MILTVMDGLSEKKFWINDDQVQNILRGDHYVRIDPKKELPKAGDVVVYFNIAPYVTHATDVGAVIVHSATALYAEKYVAQSFRPDKDGLIIGVEEKGGVQPDVLQQFVENGWNGKALFTWEYYRYPGGSATMPATMSASGPSSKP
jgi:hypothetical protein